MTADASEFSADFPRTLRALEEGRAQGWHLGAQVYIRARDRAPVDWAWGERRPGEAMTTDTLMLWLSAGKPLTALAIAQQWEAGRVDLDAPVTEHIPEFGAEGKGAITPRHLLTHTGGLRTAENLAEALPWDQTIQAICHAPLEPNWQPGVSAAYNPHASWFVLAEIVRRVDGRAFAHYVREEILLPLGLADSWLGMPPVEYQRYGPRIGTTYRAFPGPPVPHPTWDSESACSQCRPGSNARGPISQLGRLYEALLAGGGGIVKPDTAREFTRPWRTGVYDQTFRHVIDMGLGFILNSRRHGPDTVPYGYGPCASEGTFGHSGSQCACAFADPERGLVVAWAFNGLPGEPRHQRRQRAMNAAICEDLGLAETH
jgi:CubicO group peptidase (beta-lactamase class C family)